MKETDLFDEVVLKDMPDPYDARESVWLPFLLEVCKADENTIIIGHSSGAEACMRLLENHKLLGAVLVCACHTDLGCESEAIAGYYNRPWNWEAIKGHVGPFGITQFHSNDDPFIPMHEASYVADNLTSDFHTFEDKSHFFTPADANLVLKVVIAKAKALQLQK